VASFFASVAARQSLATIISGKPFTFFLFLQTRGGILDICLAYLSVHCIVLTDYHINLSINYRNCRLFEARDTAEWEREMDQLQFGNQMRNMLKPLGAVVRCPRCREKTFKVRNLYLSLKTACN
jgi:hypothetical protein